MIICFVSIVAIFLDAIKTKDGKSWLEALSSGFSSGGVNDTVVGSVVLLGLMVLFVMYATRDPKKESSGGGNH